MSELILIATLPLFAIVIALTVSVIKDLNRYSKRSKR